MIDGEQLRCDDGAHAEHLRQLIARASEAGAAEASGGSLELAGARGNMRAVVAPLPVPAPTVSEPRPAAVLFVGAPEDSDAERAQGLRELYGLTQAEARIAARLARGQRLSEIAGELEISINTVRGHLKQVFAKTGTHRQAELVRLVLSAPSQLQVA